MMMGLVASTPDRLPNAWQHGLGELDALAEMGADLPLIGVCKDAQGNIINCAEGGIMNPCDPTFVAMGYSCYVGTDGNVTYVGPGGQAPTGTPTGTPGGADTGTKPPSPPSPVSTKMSTATKIFLAALGFVVLTSAMRR